MGIAAMAALTLVSCSSDDLDSFSDNSSKNEAISFDSYLGRSAVAVNGSRSTMLNDKEALQGLEAGFGVFGNYKEANGKEFGANLFDNQQVTYKASAWTYTPLKFWPTQGHIDFLAYAPYDSKYANKVTKDNQKLEFTVEPEIKNQKDLLWANNAVDQTKDNISTTGNKVKFHFYHALSRLGYTVNLYRDYSSNPDNKATFTLNKITLAGSPDETTKAFYKNGTIDLAKTDTKENLSKTNDPKGLWTAETTAGNKQNFPWVSSDKQVDNTGIKNADTDYLFVIPQDFSKDKIKGQPDPDELYVIVEYTITYKDGKEQKNKVYKQIKKHFLQGKAYRLNLTIGLPIEFDVDVVEDWGAEDNIYIGSDVNTPWDR